MSNNEVQDDICSDRHLGNVYSRAANPSRIAKQRMRSRILLFLLKSGPATCEEIEFALSMGKEVNHVDFVPHSSCSARISELKREGSIIPTGESRPTQRGRSSAVYRYARKGEKNG
jgi:hypothetical protein